MSQRPRKRPAHLNDYELGTPNKHSKTKRVLEEHSQGQEVNLDSGIKATEHSEPAESAMECSDDENINFIPPKEVPNAGAPVEGVGNFNTHDSAPISSATEATKHSEAFLQTISSGMI